MAGARDRKGGTVAADGQESGGMHGETAPQEQGPFRSFGSPLALRIHVKRFILHEDGTWAGNLWICGVGTI